MDKRAFFAVAIIICLCLIGGFFALSGEESATRKVVVDTVKSISAYKANSPLMAHKALYEISMTSSSSGSQIVNVSGNMYFEWQPTCEAYTTDHRFNLTYEYTDAPAMRITSDFTTWEAQDGNSFNYTSRRSRDGEVYEEIRGSAVRFEDGTGQANYSLPEEIKFDLPKDFVFPMQHTKLMLDAIGDKSKKFTYSVLFDGSDTDGPIAINAFMGAPANAMARIPANPKIDTALLNGASRDTHMAFFPLHDDENPASDYEMSAIFHKNSVISDMTIEYDEFSIRQTLIALEKLDTEMNCEEK